MSNPLVTSLQQELTQALKIQAHSRKIHIELEEALQKIAWFTGNDLISPYNPHTTLGEKTGLASEVLARLAKAHERTIQTLSERRVTGRIRVILTGEAHLPEDYEPFQLRNYLTLTTKPNLAPPEILVNISPLTNPGDTIKVQDVELDRSVVYIEEDPADVIVEVIKPKTASAKTPPEPKPTIPTVDLAAPSGQLLDMLEDPSKYSFERDKETGTLAKSYVAVQSALILAAYHLTECPDLNPKNTRLTFAEKLELARELLADLQDAPTVQFPITPERQELVAKLDNLATAQAGDNPARTGEAADDLINTITRIQETTGLDLAPSKPPIPVPPRTPAAVPSHSEAAQYARGKARQQVIKVAEKLAKRFGGTAGNAIVTAKRALSGRKPKDLLKAGAMLVGFLLGGPIGVGVVVLLASKRFWRYVGLIAIASFTMALATTAYILIFLIVFTSLTVFIIQNSAYVVPLSDPLPKEQVDSRGKGDDDGDDFTNPGPGGEYPMCWPAAGTIEQGPSEAHATWMGSGQAFDISPNPEVFATHDGTAIPGCIPNVGMDGTSAYGNYICVRGNGFTTLYAHLDGDFMYITEPTEVTAGTILARADNTGTNSHGNHLHYEILGSPPSYYPPPFDIESIIPDPNYVVGGTTNGCQASSQGGSDEPPD